MILYNDGCIYPWNLPYYSSIGINNFKFVPTYQRASDTKMEQIKKYMHVIEHGIYDSNINYLCSQVGFEILSKLPRKIIIEKFLKPFTMDMEYFIEHGDECATRCRAECNYCFEKYDRFVERLKEYGIEMPNDRGRRRV